MLQVLGPRRAINQNIIEECKHEPAKEGLQHIIHEHLERSYHIRETERHDKKFEVVVVCTESRLLNVVQVHAHMWYPERKSSLVKNLAPDGTLARSSERYR